MKNFLRSLASIFLLSLAVTTVQAQVAPAYAAQGASAGQTGAIGPGSGSVTQVSIVPSDTVTGTVDNPTTTPAITLTAIQNPSPSGTNLVSGGGVEWVSGYTFTIGAATYVIQGTQYSSVITNKTLSASDPALDRIDVIAVDNTGTVVVIEGTPASTPAKPDVDPASQLELTFVYVSAASTEPIITADDIYHEGTEWTMTRSGSTFNLTSTNNPYRGTTDIEGTNVTTNNAWIATKPAAGVINLADYTTLTMYVRVKAAWPSTRQFSIQWYNNNTARGSIVTLKNGTFGFNALTNTTAYQQVSIPVSLFGANGIAINRLRVTCAGSGSTIGMYFDDVTLQSGTSPVVDSTKMQWKGTYNATVTYNVNDTVTANNVLYVCIQSGIAKDPASNADYWQVAVDASDTGVTSVTGTANEITASPTSGAVGLSLPSSLTFTGKTVTGGTFSGISLAGLLTESGTVLITPAPMAALAINVGERMNTKTVGADSTFTFSATPAANTIFGVFITNSDTSDHTMTFPSSTVVPGSGATTTATLPASGKLYLIWRYNGTGYDLISGYPASAGSSGTVTDVSVVTANGVSGSVATSTTTPAITLSLGAITPTSVNGNTTVFGNTSTAHALQNAQLVTLSSSGTDAFVGTAGVTATAYNTGDSYTFTANTANTGAASININGLGAKTIVKVAGGITTTLADNDIRSGQVCVVGYDGTNFQLQSTLGNTTSASGGTRTIAKFTALDNQPPASNFSSFGTRNSVALLYYPAGSNANSVFLSVIPQGSDLSNGLRLRIFWVAETATSGDCTLGGAWERGNTDIDSDSFSTPVTATTTTSGTSGIPNITTIDFSSSEIDGITNTDSYRLQIGRSASDSMSGGCEIMAIEVQTR